MAEHTDQSDRPKVARKDRQFDDVFDHVRSFGKFQRIMYFGLNLLILPMMGQFSALVFAMGTPQFHCSTPNVTCPLKKCCDNCTLYEFDGPFTSTVSEWNLICDHAYLGATLQSCYFAGMLIGSFVGGMMSDGWGRKNCMFFCCTVMLVAGVASSFVDCISFFAFLRFLVGFGLSGMLLSQYIYCIELVGPKRRTLAGVGDGFYWSGFAILLIVLAYFVREWRPYFLIVTVPAALLYPFWKLIPESPRWLLAHGRLDEAHAVLIKYGGKKDKPVDSEALRIVIEEVRRDQLEREREANKYTPIDLLRTKKLRRWTLMMCYQWFVVALVNFGVYLFLAQLAGNIYLNYAVMRLIEMTQVPVKWFLILKFGRRVIHGSVITLTGVACLTILAFYHDYPLVTTGLSILGFVFGVTNWATIYLITSELFPTVLRNTAQGIGSTSARVGAMLAPYIAMSGQLPGLGIWLPVTIFGVVAISAGISTYCIPETLYTKLHQTIEDAEAATDDYGIPCCLKPLNDGSDAEAQEPEKPLLEMKEGLDTTNDVTL